MLVDNVYFDEAFQVAGRSDDRFLSPYARMFKARTSRCSVVNYTTLTPYLLGLRQFDDLDQKYINPETVNYYHTIEKVL